MSSPGNQETISVLRLGRVVVDNRLFLHDLIIKNAGIAQPRRCMHIADDSAAIKAWLQDHDTSPISRQQMDPYIIPNLALRQLIEDWHEVCAAHSEKYCHYVPVAHAVSCLHHQVSRQLEQPSSSVVCALSYAKLHTNCKLYSRTLEPSCMYSAASLRILVQPVVMWASTPRCMVCFLKI